MTNNSAVYILSPFPVFNKKLVPVFEGLDKEHSSYLHSTLAFNHKELTDKLSQISDVYFFFDKKDEDFLPDIFNNTENVNLIITNSPDLKGLSDRYFHNYSSNILIFNNSIGFSFEDILKSFNLLGMEDEAIVIGKTYNYNISFVGFNSFNSEIFEDFDLKNPVYDIFLRGLSNCRSFIHILDNFMFVKDANDFKQLYDQLSKKESFAYCSQTIHERFTNLFIEYKDLLK